MEPRSREANAEVSASSPAGRLLETAAALFREQGYARATTRELAERLGLQKASLYHHMEAKEDLLYEISTKSLKDITAAVAAVADAQPRDGRLRRVIVAHMGAALAEQNLHLTMLTELRALSDQRRADIVQRRSDYEALLERIVAADQRAGRLRTDIEPKFLTLILLNLLNWTIFWYRPDGQLRPAEFAEMVSDVFLDGARPRT